MKQPEDQQLVLNLKLNKLLLNKNIENKISEYIHDKTIIQKVITFYHLASIFELPNLARKSLSCIERCFTMLAETPMFLELRYTLIAKVLISSHLHITSELEVFNAANGWLSHNLNERRKFGKQLLLKVRLSLLSEFALEQILNKISSFSCIEECVAIIKEALYSKQNMLRNKSSKNYVNRFCNQSKFSIILCGGINLKYTKAARSVHQVDCSSLNTVKVLSPMITERWCANVISLKGEIFVLGGCDINKKLIMSVENYSPVNNTWTKKTELPDDRYSFCACAFMDKIFIFGGRNDYSHFTYSLLLDTNNNKWKKIARTNEPRSSQACTVFEENIVVSGGWDHVSNHLKNVDSYEEISNTWTPMANMTTSKSGHKLVAVKSKLYVIGCEGDASEVYDNICKKFVVMKQPPKFSPKISEAIFIGSKIYVFDRHWLSTICYDVDKDEWSKEVCDYSKNLRYFGCVKYPWF